MRVLTRSLSLVTIPLAIFQSQLPDPSRHLHRLQLRRRWRTRLIHHITQALDTSLVLCNSHRLLCHPPIQRQRDLLHCLCHQTLYHNDANVQPVSTPLCNLCYHLQIVLLSQTLSNGSLPHFTLLRHRIWHEPHCLADNIPPTPRIPRHHAPPCYITQLP